ncbi:hypothetical protein SBI67_17020 [Mycolicibacterium sp. 120266]|uniref:hypothetical protein n=1 Tax=Mycolicibacterium sp. 120266 TaxID=3090601 RepID=UPI00299D4587|nr:hypothetical protein [Mycolicibacterium sp. 120266]MDX1873824.1 hypothetical protein [Mycolicibacterium sp. 120266]
MRSVIAMLTAVVTASGVIVGAAPAAAEPAPRTGDCDYPGCTPGIAPHIVLGSYCDNPTYYVFGVTDWGRLVFCGSPRRYEPRWFRSPEMRGVKGLGELCPTQEGEVAQAPDGMFLTCLARDGRTFWERGDL